MNNLFVINSAASIIDLQDGIDQRMTQIMAINNSLRVGCFVDEGELEVASDIVTSVLWAVDDLLIELKQLQSALWDKVSRKKFVDKEEDAASEK